MPVMLADITGTSAAAPPLWPYIVGGVAAFTGIVYSAGRIIQSWRTSIENEAAEKIKNTQAVDANTAATKALTEKITGILTVQDNHERRIADLEKKRSRTRQPPQRPT